MKRKKLFATIIKNKKKKTPYPSIQLMVFIMSVLTRMYGDARRMRG